MKRLLALLIVLCTLIGITGCASTGKSSVNEPVEELPVEEVVETVQGPTDEELVAKREEALVGTWGYSTIEDERLIFNQDMTGTYDSVFADPVSFTYKVELEHREYANGAPYECFILYMDYEDGQSENMIFFFQDEIMSQLAFHSYDDGGYSGILNYNEYQKR